MIRYGDAAYLVKDWLLTLPSVTALVPLPTTGAAIFLAMPSGAPNPVILINQVGGNPNARDDLPLATTRLSFDVYGRTRAQASQIAHALIAELDALARYGSFSDGGMTLYHAQVAGSRWLPDPDSDTPRYIVDALVTTVTS